MTETVRLQDLKLGDYVRIDGGFTCMEEGIYPVLFDGGDPYVECGEGWHFLSGQVDGSEDEYLVGVALSDEARYWEMAAARLSLCLSSLGHIGAVERIIPKFGRTLRKQQEKSKPTRSEYWKAFAKCLSWTVPLFFLATAAICYLIDRFMISEGQFLSPIDIALVSGFYSVLCGLLLSWRAAKAPLDPDRFKETT